MSYGLKVNSIFTAPANFCGKCSFVGCHGFSNEGEDCASYSA